MSLDTVYKHLLEVFPMVDTRVLRAVAIENSKDSQVAAQVVLEEIIPFLSAKTVSLNSATEINSCLPNSSEAATPTAVDKSESVLCENGGIVGMGDEQSDYQNSQGESAYINKVEVDLSAINATLVNENAFNNKTDQVNVDFASWIFSSSQTFQESSKEDIRGLDDLSLDGDVAPVFIQNVLLDGPENNIQLVTPVTPITYEEPEPSDSFGTVSKNDVPWSEMVVCESECTMRAMADPETPFADVDKLEQSNFTVAPSDSFVTVSKNDVPWSEMVVCENECTMRAMADPETPFADVDKLEQSNLTVAASEEGLAASEEGLAASEEGLASTVFGDFEDEANMNTSVRSQYGHIFSTQHLEDIIESSRSEKLTLHSAKESLLSLIKEVELKENTVEQAKEEAARGGLSILTNIKELKQMLQRAKEANDMNAGEVYGEQAILATEVRELQSRLLSLSDERNKAVSMLDEMRQSLEVRLEEAEKEIKAAEQERIDKEEYAHKSLAYENSIMEKVVQESKLLEQEAEKNSELREFLMDRGRLVDIIQGEISVVCQDIKCLKEKFDQLVPLSKLLSSSYTSASLTSSRSSITSTVPQQVSKVVHSPDSTKARRETSITDDQLSCKEEVCSHEKELVDDGWEFFDKQECNM